MFSVTEVLDALQISPLSSQIYLYLLENKNLTIVDLSTHFGHTRKKIYLHVDELQKAGLVIKKDKFSRNLIPANPKQIQVLLAQKQASLGLFATQIQQNLDKLEQNYSKYHNRPNAQVLTTRNQIIELYESILTEKIDKAYTFGDLKTFSEFVDPLYVAHWVKRRREKGILSQSITFDNYINHEYAKKDSEELREIRFLPAKFGSKCLWSVYGDKTTIWNPLENKVIVIQDSLIADLFAVNFELLWEGLG